MPTLAASAEPGGSRVTPVAVSDTAVRGRDGPVLGTHRIVAALAFALVASTVILGYGGDNFVLSADMPLPIPWILLAILIVFTGIPGASLVWERHRTLLILWALAFAGGLVRLAFDVTVYGIWALRSSIFFMGSVALFAGVHIGRTGRERRWTWLVTIPVTVVLIYTLSFPWQQKLWSISPVSGVFVPVPLFGHYQYFNPAAAGLWVAFFAADDFRFSRLMLLVVALLGVAMVQTRLGYMVVLLSAALTMFIVFGQRPLQSLAIRGAVAVWLVAVFLIMAALIPVSGRYGAFDPQFLLAHLNTILGHQGPEVGSVIHRYTEYPIAVKELLAQPPGQFLAGNGLGAPIDLGVTGIYRKTLHLDYAEVIYRAGLAGIFWILSTVGLGIVVVRRTRALFGSPMLGSEETTALLMICGGLVIALVSSWFEPVFFWAYGAVPFFFYGGLALGVLDSVDGPRVSASHWPSPEVAEP